MKEKRFTMFWKKLLIMDLVLIVIFVRIFGMIIGYLTKISNNDSIFPQNTENGYPFFDSINCDINTIIKILESISQEKSKKDNNTEILLNYFINSFQSNECTFNEKINICNNDKRCFDELAPNELYEGFDIMNNLTNIYHVNDNDIHGKLTVPNLLKLMKEKNQFIDKNNNIIEVESYFKLISGYQSYLNIKFYEQNNNNQKNYDIIRETTNYEDKVNNFFYLYSLLLKANTIIYPNQISSNIDSIKHIDQCLQENDDQFINDKSPFYQIKQNLDKLQEIFQDELFQIINCFPDFNQRFSYSLDIKAIKTTIFILLGNKDVTKNDKKIFNYFLKEFSESIKTIFLVDMKIRQKANIYEKYQPYFIVTFLCISIGILIFINRHFIKNRQYYSQGSRILEKYKRDRYNLMYNNKHRQYLEKLKEAKEKMEKEKMDKEKNNINAIGVNSNENNIEDKEDKNKCTKEELEYIEKLAKEYKGDFIISK